MSTTQNDNGLSPVKQALLEIRELRERLRVAERRAGAPIAIVGIGCRLPGGVTDADSYWELLESGRDAITELPRERFDVDALYDPNPDAPGKITTRWGGLLDGVDRFDAEFFGIAAREARSLDPQQRLLLEVAWEALEDAGIDPRSLHGSATGVFAGLASFDYPQLELQAAALADVDAYFATGATHSVAAGRISYVLGLKGPCIALDTACSASLVATHVACQSLRSGECDVALAGGVGILLLPEMFVDFSRARMMAADGRCKTFDAAADGYVRGEGAGMVVLKRLDDAVAAGDRVLAVVRGSAINHDGRSGGLTAPNGPSQVAVIRAALERAGVRPADVAYVEAHGTGTSLGDPIEVQALGAALGEDRPAERPLLIGSAKTNIGHLEAAAGIAGLIKAVLCVRHGVVPPSLHFRTPNPAVAWERLPVRVVTASTPWPAGMPRIAGVSSFGFSGTNAHIVLEAHDADRPSPGEAASERPLHVLTVSGRTRPALIENARRLAAALKAPSADVANVAYSRNVGRAHFDFRAAAVGADRGALVTQLERIAEGVAADLSASPSPRVCLIFGGQGSQYAGMAGALHAAQPTFRRELERCDAVLRPMLGRSLETLLYSVDSEALLADVRFAQPAIVSVQYALAQLLEEWGVHASAALGHSLGEYAAAIFAGVLTLEDGLRLVAERAELIAQRCEPGAMVAVRADPARARELAARAGPTLSIAAYNGPESVVVSGAVRDIEALLGLLEGAGVRHQRLESTRAFHNSSLEPALVEFAVRARSVVHRAPRTQLFSNLDGRAFDPGAGPDGAYWAEQARRPVRFLESLRAARDGGADLFLEVSPGAALTSLVKEAFAAEAPVAERCFTSLRRGVDDWSQLLGTVASLYGAGVPIDWRAFDRPYARQRVSVPPYAFQRVRHWYKDAVPAAAPALPAAAIDWQRCIGAGERQAAQVPVDLDLPNYAARWDLLDELTTAYILRTLRELGVFAAAGEPWTAAAIVERRNVLPLYATLVERWLSRLSALGLLARDGRGWRATAPLPEPALEPLLARCRERFTEAPYLIDYLDRCGQSLTAIVTGRESALETLFPGGSLQTAVDLYRNWPVSKYFNGIAAALVASIERELPAGETLHVVEIGAGSGGTTAAVLPALAPRRTRYRFTDVSEFFFAAAAQDFASYPFVDYAVLDIARDPEAQGFGRHAFHAVVAANVLHATHDLRATADHVLDLLRPGGLLILYEVTAPRGWLDTSVALVAGWASSADGFRDDGPLLAAGSWRKLLLDRGFEEVAIFPAADSPAAVLGMNVIAARAPAAAVPTVAPAAPMASAPRAAVAAKDSLLDALDSALPNERRDLLVDLVRGHVAAVLHRDAALEPIGRTQSLMDLGLDSLMAVELRNRLSRGLSLEQPLPVSLIFDYPHIEAIADYLASLLVPSEERAGAAPAPADTGARSADEIAALSDDDIEAMLLAKLDGGGHV